MATFKKGDIVRIAPKTRYYKPGDESNPINITGKVTNLSSCGTALEVLWENEQINNYRDSDLELANISEVLDVYNKIKNIPKIDKIISPEMRVDLKKLADCNSFGEAGLDYEQTALLLSAYETTLRRIEEKLQFYDILFEDGVKGFEKGKVVDTVPGKEKITKIIRDQKDNKKADALKDTLDKYRSKFKSASLENDTLVIDTTLNSEFDPLEQEYYDEEEYEEDEL